MIIDTYHKEQEDDHHTSSLKRVMVVIARL